MKRFNHILRISLALVIVLILTSGMFMTALAESIQIKSDTNAETLLSVDEIGGTCASSVDALFSSKSQGVNPTLSDLTLIYRDNKLVLHGILTHEGKSIKLESSGELYKNEKTENAGKYGDLILGDMSDMDDIHFVQLRIDKEKSIIIIILQMNNTKQLLQFQMSIDNDTFDKLYYLQKNQLSGLDLEKKIIELYSVIGNLIDSHSVSGKVKSTSPKVSINEVQPLATTYNGWISLINDLNANGSVKLGNYSNIDASMFKGNDWSYDEMWGSTPYSFATYSMPNGPSEYLTQFALVNIVAYSDAGTGDLFDTRMQALYQDGMIVRYDIHTDILTVIYYNFGIRYQDFAVGINGLTNNAIFISRSVNRSYESIGNIVRAAISVFGPADTIVTVFEHLLPYEDQSVNNTLYFDPTYSQQYSRYSGKVIRGIVANTEDNYLSRSGHYINVAGTVKYNTSLGTSYQFGYEYYCDSNL